MPSYDLSRQTATPAEAAKKLFKYVAGVLNGAYQLEQVSDCQTEIQRYKIGSTTCPTFALACEALACAIDAGSVHPRGIEVLCGLRDSSCSAATMSVRLLHAIDPAAKRAAEEEAVQQKNNKTMEADPAAEIENIETDAETDGEADVDTNESETSNADRPSATPASKAAVQPSAPQGPQPSIVNRLFRYVITHLTGCTPSIVAEADVRELVCGDEDADLFPEACRLLARAIVRGEVPEQGIQAILAQYDNFPDGAEELFAVMKDFMCPICEEKPPCGKLCDTCENKRTERCGKCRGSGRYTLPCRGCEGKGSGKGRKCTMCGGKGKRDLGECSTCSGKGGWSCTDCAVASGTPRNPCADCAADRRQLKQQRSLQQRLERGDNRQSFRKETGPPKKGMTVEKATKGDLTRLKTLWTQRGGPGEIEAAWKVDNPLSAHVFKERREELKKMLGGKDPDGLEGFHGTHPDAILSISENGFDAKRRSGQVYGAGEYFAKNPSVSVGYCRGGQYMLVCRLTLGYESSDMSNSDGDHIWAKDTQYYVISKPEQVLPTHIVKFNSNTGRYGGYGGYRGSVKNENLEETLALTKWTTKEKEEIKPVPLQRPCKMSRPEATVLWMGFLHLHLSDESLQKDIRNFLTKHAKQYTAGIKIQIVAAHFKKAHAILQVPMPKSLVHKLNMLPFIEDGKERTICVDDGHGSLGNPCPRSIAGYCRGLNLRYTHPCWNSHKPRMTTDARYSLKELDLGGAKAVELRDKFMASAPFHNGYPKIVAIRSIHNETLSRCHEEYRQYLVNKHMEEPAVQELYHGTNCNILDLIYTHGIQPPADYNADDRCPSSGKKRLHTSLCNNDCKFCTERHEWNKCHMYGLGIYLADMSQKSNRYVSQPKCVNARERYRMVVTSVLGKSFQVEGHLKNAQAMHDVVNVRALGEDELDDMIEGICQPCERSGVRSKDSSSGLGKVVEDSATGARLGRVIREDSIGANAKFWILHTGRRLKQSEEGVTWQFSEQEELDADNMEVAEKSDLIFVKGLGGSVRPGFSVVNSEYIAFHPYQCLPRYEIEYELG